MARHQLNVISMPLHTHRQAHTHTYTHIHGINTHQTPKTHNFHSTVLSICH